MNIFELFGTIAINNKDAHKSLDDTSTKAERTGARIQAAFKNIGSASIKIGKAVVAGAAAIGTAFTATVETTRDYRTAMAKLEAAFTSNKFTAETAKKTYQGLQAVLGDTDQAVEAANHLAVMCNSEQDLAKWTDICTGVYATFGDSLPIEGLTESANETAKVGQVTGSLADALNWAGISEDDFNKQLAACTTEEERQDLIMNTLYWTYLKASIRYKQTAKDVMTANTAQDKLNGALAKLGEIGEPIMTGFKNWVADMVTAAAPHLQTLVSKLVNFDETMRTNIWPWIQKKAEVLLGVTLPDWETFKTEVQEVWWPDVKSKIESWCKFQLAVLGILPWNEENTKFMIDWWDGVYAKIGEICSWKLPSPSELTEEDAEKTITMIETWWNGIIERLKLYIGITPQVEEKHEAYEEAIAEASQGNPVAKEIIDSSMRNSDSFYDWGAILGTLFKRKPASVPLEVSEDSESAMQGQVDAMNLEGTVTLYPDMTNMNSLPMYTGGTYSGGGAGNRVPESRASGLDRVPYDGYFARLHKDEAILNSAQASAWRGGGSGKIEALLAQMVNLLSAGQSIRLDSGVMVGQLAPAMDAQLGTISARKGRGN